MKYWGAQELINSGRLPLKHQNEIASLVEAGIPMSWTTLAELHQIVCAMPACTSMVIVRSNGAPFRRVYLERPTQENWITLERAGFVLTHDHFGFVMDALH